MSNNDNPDSIREFLIENIVGELFQVQPTVSRRIEMVVLWVDPDLPESV